MESTATRSPSPSATTRNGATKRKARTASGGHDQESDADDRGHLGGADRLGGDDARQHGVGLDSLGG